MIIVTEHRQIAPRSERPFLSAKPQRLGILPTWWFWKHKDNWKLVRALFAVVAGIAVVTVSVLDLPPAVAGFLVSMTIYMGVGLLERHVRSKAKRLACADPGLAHDPSHRD